MTEWSSQSVNVTTPASAEQDIPRGTKASQDVVPLLEVLTERENVANPITVLVVENMKVFSSLEESSLKTPSKPMDPTLADDCDTSCF
jgi:hypothetical protein